MKNAVSTRIRCARNLVGVKFLSSMNSDEKRDLLLKIKDEAKKIGDFDFIDMSALSDIRAGELMEKHLISPEFAENRENCGVLLGKDGHEGFRNAASSRNDRNRRNRKTSVCSFAERSYRKRSLRRRNESGRSDLSDIQPRIARIIQRRDNRTP